MFLGAETRKGNFGSYWWSTQVSKLETKSFNGNKKEGQSCMCVLITIFIGQWWISNGFTLKTRQNNRGGR